MSLYNSPSGPERWHLVRKVFLLLLLVVAAALGLVILFRKAGTFPLTLFNVLADVGLGLLVGVGARLTLRKRHGIIQAIASAALSTVGLAILGYFTNSRLGIGPLPSVLVRVHWLDAAHLALWLPLAYARAPMDLVDLAHLVIAVDTSWIALRAWKRRRGTALQAVTAAPAWSKPARAPLSHVSMVSPSPARQVRAPASSGGRPRVKQRRFSRPLLSTGAAALRGPVRPRAKHWNPLHHRPEVQLAVFEEHRCPYCLEDVSRNDARGAVECPVCHTLHHKDCWDITGTCQVPHLNT